LIFLRDIVSLKPTIVQIIGHFLISAKFHEILWPYQNSAGKGKFCGRRKTAGPSYNLHYN